MKEYTLDVGLFAPTIKEQLDSQEVYMKEKAYTKIGFLQIL